MQTLFLSHLDCVCEAEDVVTSFSIRNYGLLQCYDPLL